MVWLWVPATLVAAGAQVLRNGAQAQLTGKIGTLGATQVRFIFGLPFAVLFLLLGTALGGWTLARPGALVLGWAALGAVSQIIATALMLVVMRHRAFGVAYAYIKTEPVLVALLGVALLGDRLPPQSWLAVLLVTLGVLLASVKPGQWRSLLGEGRMMAAGIGAGGLFGLSAIAFRGAIGGLDSGGFVQRSLEVLVLSLGLQCALLGLWLALFQRQAFTASLREWRTSLGAGSLGALSSACLFIAFSLTPAANVRTLALVEMPLAALLSGRLTGKVMERRELAGMAVVMGGLALLLAGLAR